MKYCNLMPGIPELMRRCTQDGLWIHYHNKWWPPYHWAFRFGVVYMGMDWQPKLASPRSLIDDSRTKVLTGRQVAAVIRFEAKVEAYYEADWDDRLLRSMECGVWC